MNEKEKEFLYERIHYLTETVHHLENNISNILQALDKQADIINKLMSEEHFRTMQNNVAATEINEKSKAFNAILRAHKEKIKKEV